MATLVQKIINFPYGTINTVEDQAIPDGAASASLNWVTLGDRIELRRGYRVLGTEITGSGKITGLHIATKNDGTQIPYRKRGRKLEYYDASLATPDWVEVGTNLFPALATNDDASFANYASLAGNQMWVSSPNSGLYKIMVANPGSYTDMTHASNFKGRIKIKYNRMLLWFRTADETGIYGSYIDTQTYTTVTAEARHNGDGSTRTFTGTLAFKAGLARRTCFAVTFTDGTESFTDDYNGVLTGSAGGTGTINYTTGAYSITFAVAPIVGVNNITATYQHEDSVTNGIADFTKSSPRVAGQGFIFRQDDGGGAMQNAFTLGSTEYCIHENKTWALNITQTDTAATNLPYRDQVGMPNWRAGVATGEGIFYMDAVNKKDPQMRKLTLDVLAAEVIPVSVSKSRKLGGNLVGLDLSGYEFDKAVMDEWGDYVILLARTSNSSENNRMIMYNKKSGAMDTMDIYGSCIVKYNGNLLVGDSVTDNVYEILTGFDDNNANIANYWISNLSTLQIEELKKCKKLVVQGQISRDQALRVSIAVDNGAYIEVGTIEGTGDYVDAENVYRLGNIMLGAVELGGGGSGIDTYNYEKTIRLSLDKFYQAKVKFEATELGYVSVNRYRWFDIRPKGMKIVAKYR